MHATKRGRQIAAASSKGGHFTQRVAPDKPFHHHHVFGPQIGHCRFQVVGHHQVIDNRRAVLAVCGHDFQCGQTSRIEAALLQQGMHQWNAQPFPHADKGVAGVVCEFVEQLKSFANRTDVRHPLLDFRQHRFFGCALNQRLASLAVPNMQFVHHRLPVGAAFFGLLTSTDQGVRGPTHGRQDDKLGHGLPSLKHVGDLPHRSRIDERTASKFDDFHGVLGCCGQAPHKKLRNKRDLAVQHAMEHCPAHAVNASLCLWAKL